MKKTRKIAIVILILLSIALLASGVGAYRTVTKDAYLRKELLPNAQARTIIYDGADHEIAHGSYAKIDEISPYIKNAFIAIEDKRFYRHIGVDVIRMGGAAFENIKSGGIRQGGSTITCQLVKNTHLSNEKTLKRKIKESKIALQLEKAYSKDEILEMYLNVIYFGKGLYGVKAACETFFAKEPNTVTLSEAAALAATVVNPSRYSPSQDPNENFERKKVVLAEMVKSGMITEEERKIAASDKIIINYAKFDNNCIENYINLTYSEAQEILGIPIKQIKSRGYKIYTYLDTTVQSKAYDALLRDETTADKEVLIAENRIGGVIAYASTGKESLPKRQPGSLLKPFIYAEAIERGIILPDSPIEDAPIEINGYAPSNYKGIYYGWISAKEALSRSSNAVSVFLLREIGIENGYQTIERCGIPLVQKDKNLSLALGGTTKGSDLLELATGYLTIASEGHHRPLAVIRKITDENGRVLYNRMTERDRALSEESAFLTTEMLKECAKTGTAKQLSYLSIPIAAKTGTVAKGDGNADAWCAGFTSEHTFVCRYGAPSGTVLPTTVTGGNQPTKAIRTILRDLYRESTPEDFSSPSAIRKVKISTLVRNKYHKLAPAESWDAEESVEIYATRSFIFEKIDPDRLFLENFEIKSEGNTVKITFSHAKTIDYQVKINDKRGFCYAGTYLFKRPAIPLAKLEIECFSAGKRIYRRSEIVRL